MFILKRRHSDNLQDVEKLREVVLLDSELFC